MRDLVVPKIKISIEQSVATAGSCFAQHIGRHLRNSGVKVLDAEPAPSYLSKDERSKYGFDTYSARYGNIYSSRQLLQLVREAFGEVDVSPELEKWTKAGRFFDPFRPTIEPLGFGSLDEMVFHRAFHMRAVKRLLLEADVFVFTLGLTECWVTADERLIFPTAPGVAAGTYDGSYKFKNLTVAEVVDDITAVAELLTNVRGRALPILLTVSPVPLVATASVEHVLLANTYSKSVLRTSAGQLSASNELIDYFPSYEIVSNTWFGASNFEADRRSVSEAAVESVMDIFLRAHDLMPSSSFKASSADDCQERLDIVCEEILNDAVLAAQATRSLQR